MLLLLLLAGCEPPPPWEASEGSEGSERADGPNVLLVILDDIGPEKTSVYGEGPPTPNLEALAAEGVRFDRAYADPFCSPTRAGLLTGRHAYHYGIGTYLTTRTRWWLPGEEVTLAEALPGYETVAVGKFHLGGEKDARPHGSFAMVQGFGHYEGAPENLQGGELADGEVEDYFHYDRLDGGEWSLFDGYATTDVTDSALRAIEDTPEPWFVHVGYHAAHKPWHAPPDDLNPLGAVDGDDDPTLYEAMVASVDQDMGRLLDAVDLRGTVIIVVGDNGTPPEVKTGAYAGLPGKGTVYEGGTRVPLIVAGAGVVPGTSEALVSHVDLFATIVDLTGVEAEVPEDSTSFAPLLADPTGPSQRDHVYAETFEPRGLGPYTERYDRMVRDERFKLVRRLGVPDQLFDLEADPTEQHDLLGARLDGDAHAAKETLNAQMVQYQAFGW